MSLSGSRLDTALFGTIFAGIQAAFPVPAGLLPTEQASITTSQTKIAHAIADESGDDIVTEITSNAVVPLGIAVATTGGPSAQTGATTAAGTVS